MGPSDTKRSKTYETNLRTVVKIKHTITTVIDRSLSFSFTEEELNSDEGYEPVGVHKILPTIDQKA